VKYSYIDMPEESEGSESDAEDVSDEKKEEKQGTGSDSEVGELREYSFWATIGCGPVRG
jgi:hypothetical protein